MSESVKCPVCGLTDVEVCCDEVDNEVGIQRFVWGYVCKKCGEIPVCPDCGACIASPGDHMVWCERDKE
jgi:hypothetical protein